MWVPVCLKRPFETRADRLRPCLKRRTTPSRWTWQLDAPQELPRKDGNHRNSSLFDFAFGNSLELPNVGFAIGLGLHQHPKLFIVVDQLDGVVV